MSRLDTTIGFENVPRIWENGSGFRHLLTIQHQGAEGEVSGRRTGTTGRKEECDACCKVS
ncbi:MAG: hypothetical protein E6I80_04195 [Chloroflexi bacterium]|nr:MAG: hypothetical protein E6I80_04195 [Chloroflexota bacterium]